VRLRHIPQAGLTRDGAQGMAAFAVFSRNAFIAAAAGVLTPLALIERPAASAPLLRGSGAQCIARLVSYRASELMNFRKQPFVGPDPDWLLRVERGN
jgi:hypothetical protein